ncbi:MAG: hypothetical protein UY62_C0036G0006 [Parcubacteria group bacterium GW2011_GWF2_50_9]|nr:MAG: hypothetical protein UY62_C0036G0006 [Parcubacteria group bacterium GW2011_GWF2_50_9]
MKTLTQEELEKRMKRWISNRDEILDFYVKLADEPTKRMIEQTIRHCRHIIPRSIVHKAAERARTKNIKCACGSDQFKAQKITLKLRGVPCEITSDGPEYDDKAADYSEGWDYNNESRVTCVACGKEYDIAQDDKAGICLWPVWDESYENRKTR